MVDKLLLGLLPKTLQMLTAMERSIEERGIVIIPMEEATTVNKDITKKQSLKFLL